MTDVQRQCMQTIIRERNDTYVDWGFKDPRTCFTYSLWLSYLPTHKIIAIHRAPEELWERYRRVQPFWRFTDVMTAWKVMRSWYEHNLSLIRILQQTDMEYSVLNYGQLMSGEDEFIRMQNFIKRHLVDQRESTLYRHKSNSISLPLMVASTLAHRKWGQTPADIIRQLESFRKS